MVGAAIATKVVNPALALPLALGSHFILDRIPHWNPHLFTETQKYGQPSQKSTILAWVDVGVSLGLGLFVASRYLQDPGKVALILACCLASVLPDLVKWPYYFLKKRGGLLEKWVFFERKLQVNASFWPGVFTQLALIVASFWWIFT
ncbi:MAG: hypothetical protein UX19_C0006G0009 [Candidatus Woesebacteria bacterium GW2011_GWA1_45_8]|uniref:Uncharacterized protein n=1 Tax=Candidatus Woesebacteria bacterium GW2011_GWA1_45_8 TaxID=1618559 RepID=A0A0G1Q367_9BACT|nr:MAG: hypothetical protein UX19_C0006G0009 [Candidatus Woesebacteria bacterium GW2011_GWA1_45_8]